MNNQFMDRLDPPSIMGSIMESKNLIFAQISGIVLNES